MPFHGSPRMSHAPHAFGCACPRDWDQIRPNKHPGEAVQNHSHCIRGPFPASAQRWLGVSYLLPCSSSRGAATLTFDCGTPLPQRLHFYTRLRSLIIHRFSVCVRKAFVLSSLILPAKILNPVWAGTSAHQGYWQLTDSWVNVCRVDSVGFCAFLSWH